MIDLKISRELAEALTNMLVEYPKEKSKDRLTQALQNYGQELIREVASQTSDYINDFWRNR